MRSNKAAPAYWKGEWQRIASGAAKLASYYYVSKLAELIKKIVSFTKAPAPAAGAQKTFDLSA